MSDSPVVCCLCGKPIDLRAVLEGTSDWYTFVNQNTGDLLHYHPACLGEFDVTAQAVELGEGDTSITALLLAYDDEMTARLSFDSLKRAADDSTLTVSFSPAVGRQRYVLTITVQGIRRITIPSFDAVGVEAIRRSVETTGSYALVGALLGPPLSLVNDQNPLAIAQTHVTIGAAVVERIR